MEENKENQDPVNDDQSNNDFPVFGFRCTPEQKKRLHDYKSFRVKNGLSKTDGDAFIDLLNAVESNFFSSFKTK